MDGSGRLGRGRRLRLVLGAAVFCAAGPGSVLAQATFSAIEVKGNQRIETATVLSYAGLPTNAPVSVGDGAYSGAGTVIREDVPAGALTVSAGKQRIIEGWTEAKRPGTPAAEAAKEARLRESQD